MSHNVLEKCEGWSESKTVGDHVDGVGDTKSKITVYMMMVMVMVMVMMMMMVVMMMMAVVITLIQSRYQVCARTRVSIKFLHFVL